MNNKKFFLIFRFTGQHLEVFAIRKNKIIKKRKIRTGHMMSEKLWKILPLFINIKDKVAVAVIIYNTGQVSFSSLRTVITIMNTLRAVKNIPIIRLDKIPKSKLDGLVKEIENRINRRKKFGYLKAEYSP